MRDFELYGHMASSSNVDMPKLTYKLFGQLYLSCIRLSLVFNTSTKKTLAQNMLTILGSIVNTNEGTCMTT
jgi:hypothetical protein